MWLRPLPWVAVIVIGLVASGGCGSGNGVSAGAGPIAAGGEFVSVPSSTFEVVAGTRVELGVADGSLSASAGCNSMGGPVKVNGSILEVDELMSTQIACTDDLMAQDARLTALLTGRPEVSGSADGFTLTAPDGTTLVMVDRSMVEPDRDVEGTVWVLNSVVSGETAATAVGFDTVQITLSDGVLRLTTPCGSGQAGYTIADDGTFVFSPVTLTPVVDSGGSQCPQPTVPEAQQAQEALLAVLQSAVTVSVDGPTLTLAGTDAAVVFVAE